MFSCFFYFFYFFLKMNKIGYGGEFVIVATECKTFFPAGVPPSELALTAITLSSVFELPRC